MYWWKNYMAQVTSYTGFGGIAQRKENTQKTEA
jgi:hypothetical protein